MKKRLLTIILALCMTLSLWPAAALAADTASPAESVGVYAAVANPTDTATAENVLGVLSQYDADAYHIMKTEYDGGTNIMIWFFGGPIISQIDTAVHETYHSYTFNQAGSFYAERIYIGGGKTYDVDYSVVYNSGNFTKTEDMARNIPASLRTFRYDTYVGPGASPDANTKGVFGLLNEFTAYCWGLETMNSLAQYLLDTDAGKDGWKAYVSSVGNNITAYAEFKYWTLRYMNYIKSANPTLYQSILSNTSYCAAYRDADAKFTAEIDRSRGIVNSTQQHLQNKGCSIEWTDSGIYLRSGYMGSGLDLDDYNVLTAELAKPEYTEMDAVLKGNSPQQPSQPAQPTHAATAQPTNDKLSVDGKDATPAAYKIGGANYFKLRDVAMLLNGTDAQFSIDYDNARKAIMITTGRPYSPQGYELQAMPAGSAGADTSNDAVYINGSKVDLTAYKINGANFYGIRDLGRALGFNVGWSQNRGMYIESNKPYSDAD